MRPIHSLVCFLASAALAVSNAIPYFPGEAMYLVEFTKELRDFDQFYAELAENGISATPKKNWTYPILYGATFYVLEVSKMDVAKTLSGMEHAKEWWSWPDVPLRMSPACLPSGSFSQVPFTDMLVVGIVIAEGLYNILSRTATILGDAANMGDWGGVMVERAR